jgi:uncharacterized protein YqfA (UPF0365 family)
MEAAGLHPEELMDDISQSTMGKTMAMSIVLHLLVIGLTSIGFIRLCNQYKTLHPRWEIQRVQREEAEKKAAADAAKAEAEAIARSQEIKAQMAAAAAKATTAGDDQTPGEAAGAEPRLSKIEQTIRETSDERPQAPTVSLDNVDEL